MGRFFLTDYWTFIRRLTRDRRASRLFIFLALWTVNLLVQPWLVLPDYDRSFARYWRYVRGFLPFCLVLLVLGTWAILRRWRAQNNLISMSGTEPQVASTPSELALYAYLAHRAAIIAALLGRCSSEIYMQHKELPDGVQVITRQVIIGFLKDHSLWEHLERTEADLIMAPDGHWSESQLEKCALWSEQLRMLRWTLQIDRELLPLAAFPQVDFAQSERVMLEYPRIAKAKSFLDSYDLRIARDDAYKYFLRTAAEGAGRGQLATLSPNHPWVRDVQERFATPSSDLLAGGRGVSELPLDALQRFAVICNIRYKFAAYLTEVLSADAVFPYSQWEEQQPEAVRTRI